MKIITINRPAQDETTKPEDVQLIDGKRYSWIVRTERPKLDESINEWFQRKEEEITRHNEKDNTNIEGIFLYDIEALYQGVGVEGTFSKPTEEWPKKICYYIRYDYIKNGNS